MNFLASGVAPRRTGNAHPNLAPYQAFPTADGWIIIAVGNDGQFQRLCATSASTRSRATRATRRTRRAT